MAQILYNVCRRLIVFSPSPEINMETAKKNLFARSMYLLARFVCLSRRAMVGRWDFCVLPTGRINRALVQDFRGWVT